MESYFYLAEYYDMLMEDVNYNEWCRFIQDIFGQYGLSPKDILDTACGTGNITIPMSKQGYSLWGVDLSEEMLTVAENKARKNKQNIKFIKQNMAGLALNRCFDAVLCMCDGVNYIIEEEELEQYFKTVFQLLQNKGVFIFDISSSYKLSVTLGNNSLFQEKEDFCYVWENSFFEEDNLLEMRLNFFIPTDGLYRRVEEYHTQKAYSIEYLLEKLNAAGFQNIQVFDDLMMTKPNEKTQRVFFAAQKM